MRNPTVGTKLGGRLLLLSVVLVLKIEVVVELNTYLLKKRVDDNCCSFCIGHNTK